MKPVTGLSKILANRVCRHQWLLLSVVACMSVTAGCLSPGPYDHLQHCSLDASQWRYLETPPAEEAWLLPGRAKKPPAQRELLRWFESIRGPRALVACSPGPDWDSHTGFAGCGARTTHFTPEMLEKKVVPEGLKESVTLC